MLAQEVKVVEWQKKWLLVKYRLVKDELGERYSVELVDTFDTKQKACDKAKLYEFIFKRNQEELERIRKVVNKYVEHIIPRSAKPVRKASKEA